MPESSTIHPDMLRNLKRVNAHLASIAYPILLEIGALRESRLRPAVRQRRPRPACINTRRTGAVA